ncbi:MAG TPA: glycoside hydrolase family 38 C-terminal domain-containing protein [Terriglobia bacterium]|nr:glycoside hydrolase family 38 C-terminal domain-containing protein [Terriglobia bacterium]
MSRVTACILTIVGLASISLAQAPPSSNARPKDYTAWVVGYAHMDMAWLWRWEESIHDIMYNTFSNQLRLMDLNPDYTYTQDQAVVIDSMEHFYPEIFKGIVQKARTQNFIPATSGWVQMDENVIDGESLVRQFLYGQKYSQATFGHYIRSAWQPDVFGHPITMPQIAHKAGIEFYVFNRPHDSNRPPIILWQAPDGSRVIGYTTPGEYTQPMDHDHTTVLGMKNADRAGVKNILVLYGMGDHGGGPNPVDIANIAKLNASPDDVNVRTTNVANYIDILTTEKKDFPVWEKELNPVFPGCYTTQVDMKRHNRMTEQLLLNAEKMSELAVAAGYRDYYPVRDISAAWKLALLNQAHDLAAGSGIGPIYADAAKQYDEIFERGYRALNFSLENIGLQLDTRGEGVPVVVYNPQSFDRTDLVTAEVAGMNLPARMVAVRGGQAVPVQIIKAPAKGPGARETATVIFVAKDVPQMGLKLYRLASETGAAKIATSTLQSGSKPRPFLENEFFRLEVNPGTGNIARIYDKTNKREVFHGEGNGLTAWEDSALKAKFDSADYAGPAWNIGLTGKKWEVDKAASVDVTEQGPVRATIRVVRRFRDSKFTQDISLIAGVPRVDVSMTLDWYERETFLKADFPIAVQSSKVSAEVPYGAIEREQNGEEAVMGKWVDISAGDYGVAILNNGRNGYDAKDNSIHLSVIRGPWGPDPRADEGEHVLGYSLYPHAGDWRQAHVPFQAMAFNSPLLSMQEPQHGSPQEIWAGKKGGLPDSYSFIKTGSDHVVLYALKQMEGFYDTDAIARFVECEGREGDVTLEMPLKVRASETTLLEDVPVGPVGEGTTIHFHMKPWEIKTLRLARVQ